MRIIGGSCKGKQIVPPAGYKARPTTDFAKEGLFNILDNEYELKDLMVLDLFGGTGSIAFEFASRGAARVYCVEMVRDNVFDFLPICREKFDSVFADPPYALEGLEGLPDLVFQAGILHPGCYFILEHGGEHNFTSHPRFVKERHYGRVHFSFFE